MPRAERPKIDPYQQVTDRIVEMLEQGVRPWSKPWTVAGGADVTRPLRVNGTPYSGINVVLLWSTAMANGYTAPIWMTFNQAKALKGSVRKGEKGTFIIYASKFKKEVDDGKGGTKEVAIPFMKGYTVFNVEQIDGLPERFYPKPAEPVSEGKRLDRIEHAEHFFAATGAVVRHGGGSAHYVPSTDHIQMPPVDSFKDIESYYATLGHEHIHWTGSAKRLKRDFSGRFGDQAYAAEELVAELGAAFLCADLGITLEVREDHAAYLASWLKVLKGDKRFIVTAASQAQKAVEHLKAYSVGDEKPEADDTVEAPAVAEMARAA